MGFSLKTVWPAHGFHSFRSPRIPVAFSRHFLPVDVSGIAETFLLGATAIQRIEHVAVGTRATMRRIVVAGVEHVPHIQAAPCRAAGSGSGGWSRAALRHWRIRRAVRRGGVARIVAVARLRRGTPIVRCRIVGARSGVTLVSRSRGGRNGRKVGRVRVVESRSRASAALSLHNQNITLDPRLWVGARMNCLTGSGMEDARGCGAPSMGGRPYG
jgi:hypothetical protein